MMTKKQLRKEFLQKRMLLNAAEQEQRIIKMVLQFTNIYLPELAYAMSYMTLAAKNEIVAAPFEKAMIHKYRECRFCYPRINPADSSMEAIAYVEGMEISTDKWDVPEPQGGDNTDPQLIDLILVPLLCFDRRGYRVGYGKGFYDRFIPRCRPDVITVGLSFFKPVNNIEDVDQYDIPLRYCITPQDLYTF